MLQKTALSALLIMSRYLGIQGHCQAALALVDVLEKCQYKSLKIIVHKVRKGLSGTFAVALTRSQRASLTSEVSRALSNFQ
eukprot:1137333-Pelagomonas_calceolata.AAC.19